MDNIKEGKKRVGLLIVGWISCCLEGWKEKEYIIYKIGRIVAQEQIYEIGVLETFEELIKILLVISGIACIPLIWLEFIIYLSRGLKYNERNEIIKISILSIFLIGLGLKGIIDSLGPSIGKIGGEIANNVGIEYIQAIGKYIEYLGNIGLTFILIGQIPLFIYLGEKHGWIKSGEKGKRRRWLYILIGVLGLFLTPPDLGSLILVWILGIFFYEIFIILYLLLKYS